ncbi:MAG: DUF1186 family protein [Muribaculaceae bacterium]|nr:DUF1186 family protein [Muribaculaceae bacterium]
MAQKKVKNKKKAQQVPMSPERFMREKARTLPIGKCYITPDWETNGLAQVIVSRIRPNGNIAGVMFLVDTFCLGVKDAKINVNMEPDDFEDLIHGLQEDLGLEEISYNEAHNLIYGAISFAEEGGINPAKEFHIGQYILEEDTEDIPLIEYDYGKNGKHLLIIGADKKEKHYLKTLRNILGDNFNYIEEGAEFDNPYFYDNTKHYPQEQYKYQYPEYPATLSVKNQFIADALFSPDNYDSMPKETIERILALPADEAADDLSNIVMYSIGKTYKAINEGKVEDLENGAIYHALVLLTQLQSEKGLDAVLEIMRQTDEFADYHLGDLAPEVIHPALYACGKDNVKRIEQYLYEPNLDPYLREQAPEALAMIAINHPERREEIIEVFRRLLKSMPTRLPIQDCCDAEYAGFVMSALADLQAKELLPEIEAVFATDLVDESVAGGYEDIVSEMEVTPSDFTLDKYRFPDIYAQYRRLQNFG